jgi:hypothetical protein
VPISEKPFTWLTRTSKHTPPGHGDAVSIGDDELHPVVPGANAHTLVTGEQRNSTGILLVSRFRAKCLYDEAESEFTAMPGGIRHE